LNSKASEEGVPWILLSTYLMNGLSNLDETYREYSLAPTDDLVRFWRSLVKITAGCLGGEVINFNVGASKSIFWFGQPLGLLSFTA